MEQHFLAFDLGATSGRGIVGTLEDGKLSLREICRFKTGGIQTPTHLYWDILKFFEEMKNGLKQCAEEHLSLAGIGVDTWGVDYAFLDERGNLLSNPINYRDPRTHGEMDQFFTQIPKERLFEITGLQFMSINTLFQLSAHLRESHYLTDLNLKFLHIPDLLNYFLTGRTCSEYTIASTSQLLDARARVWSGEIIRELGLPATTFPEIIPPGTIVGTLDPTLQKEVGLCGVPVIAPACHDTGSAVAAVPATGDDSWVFISSGTWSLVGMEVPEPVLTPETLAQNFTNEGGVAGTIRLLKNVQGLWILQQCKESWFIQDPTLSHGAVSKAALAAPAFEQYIFPDHISFLLPENMNRAISEYCKQTGQECPEGVGPVARCVLQSLAFRYRETMEALKKSTGIKPAVIHIVGGGSQDEALNQFTANATGCRVIAGPTEATAIGNVLVQAMATGVIRDIGELRQVVRDSFPLKEYIPKDVQAWEEGYKTYQTNTARRESY